MCLCCFSLGRGSVLCTRCVPYRICVITLFQDICKCFPPAQRLLKSIHLFSPLCSWCTGVSPLKVLEENKFDSVRKQLIQIAFMSLPGLWERRNIFAYQNYRVTAWVKLEGNSGGCLVQLPAQAGIPRADCCGFWRSPGIIPFCRLCPLPVLALGSSQKSMAPSYCFFPSDVYGHWWDSLELPLLQAGYSQLSWLLFISWNVYC